MAWTDSKGNTFREHRDIVDETRYREWIVNDSEHDELVCPHCGGWLRVNLARLLKSMQSSDLRPCPYCWRNARLPGRRK